MTITHPDQIAKTRELDAPGVMFPKGAHQMVAFCYAMEGVPAWEVSTHARMIAMRDSGEVEPFCADSVNMKGMTTVEKRGECANLRRQIEEMDGADTRFLSGIFGVMTSASTYLGLELMALQAYELLTSGRHKVGRSRRYVADLVLCSVRPTFRRDVNCPQEIIRRHGDQRKIRFPRFWSDQAMFSPKRG